METLRELLEQDGYDSCNNASIVVYDRLYGTMAVSHRYLAGGWNDVLNSNAVRLSKGEYQTFKL